MVVVSAALLAGCTGGDPDAATSTTLAPAGSTTAPTFDPRCAAQASGADAATTTTTATEQCAEEQFRAMLALPENSAASKIPIDRATVLAQGLCSYAEGLPSIQQWPTFDELTASNASTWNVSRKAAAAITRAASALCPAAIATVNALPSSDGPIHVTYRVDGEGTATVDYTSGNEGFTRATITAPWTVTLDVVSDGALSIVATPDQVDGGQLLCTIEVDGAKLDESSGDPTDRGIAACSVPSDVARRSRR